MTKKKKEFEDLISKEFKDEINHHLADMDKHDLITYKLYVNRWNLLKGDKIKPNAFLGNWYAGRFPEKDEFVVMSSNCGDNGYVIPYDYAIFQIGNELNDSYRGLVDSLNDITEQISKLKKTASNKNVSLKRLAKDIEKLEVRKKTPIYFGDCKNSMTMKPASWWKK